MQNPSYLEQLNKITHVVADSGDFNILHKFKAIDATTNPTLLLRAVEKEEYVDLLKDAIQVTNASYQYAKEKLNPEASESQLVELVCDKLAINFGRQILYGCVMLRKIIPGRVSTEVSAKLSFNKEKTIAKAKQLIEMYKEVGIPQSRVLIKVAATWEGIMAAKELEKQGINCNLTLIFHFIQAVACAQNNITLVSPFVQRISDWYEKRKGETFELDKAPGVKMVQQIYNYFKKFDHPTIVMAASLRKVGTIIALAGCDKLTMPPALIEELEKNKGILEPELTVEKAKESDEEKLEVDEALFRWAINEDEMAVEKIAEGIRLFAADADKLEAIVKKALS